MNGIYHADFISPLGSGSGTVSLENGVLRGGDAVVAYQGTYSFAGDTLNAQVKIIKHGSGFSILGEATVLSFQGKKEGGIVNGTGTIPGDIALQAKISLRKIAEL
jgi:hypothetical protein